MIGRDRSWETNIINIAGNHDIGYAKDITEEILHRFEMVLKRGSKWLCAIYDQ